MTFSEGSTTTVQKSCRRRDCEEPTVGAGLCAQHWARWQNGADERELSDDTRPGPPRQVWQPPTGR